MTETATARMDDSHEKAFAAAHQDATIALKEALLRRVRELSPAEFERLVVRLLIKLKYGCHGEVTGKSGDFGIDGVVYEDLLGFSQILVQAKRWTDSVGRPDVQQFYGALLGRAASKGVFLTTSTFTKEARTYVASLVPKVVLIDGSQLADLMYDCNIGVAPVATYEVKRLTETLL